MNFPNIVCTEHTLWGSPRIDGRRLAVGDVVSIVRNDSLSEAIDVYEMTLDQIKQALQYCSVRQCVADEPAVFCHNCSLRSQQEGPLDTAELEEFVSESGTMVRGGGLIIFGTMDELLADWQGRDWWVVASELLIDLRNELLQNEQIAP